ncbi:MAG TPA: hypothetical protein VFJ09_16245 [Nocardioidaceae bacterium]|nr:hypothetical protein [Nocardioidaceae bacterium]
MIRAAAVCPQPPLLFRELAGTHDAAAALREACHRAVADVLAASPDAVVVVGGGEASASWDAALEPGPGVFGGPPGTARGRLPLSLAVGRRLLAEAGWAGPVELRAVAWGASRAEVEQLGEQLASREDDIVLLVLGDGSARRGDKAPGYVDERAFGFDAETGRALAEGDPAGLLDQDAGLADELMAGGRAAFQVMAAAVRAQGGAPQAKVGYSDDPFGVMYVVATWRM